MNLLYILFVFVIFGIAFLTFTNYSEIAEKISSWLWVFLIATVLYQIVISYFNIQKVKQFSHRIKKSSYFLEKHKYLFGFSLFVLFLLISSLNRTYYFGGDDTRLFYLYPDLFYKNFVSNIVTDNSFSNVGNFLPPPSILFFTYFVWFLKLLLPFANIQSLLYTLNIIFGFYFFYLLISYILPTKDKYTTIAYYISSAMYVFSIFNSYTLYNSKLIAIFILSIFPLSLYLFIRGVIEKKIYYLATVSLILTLFTFVSAASLWFLASSLVVLPLVLFIIRPYWKTTIVYLSIFILFITLLNIHWLIFVLQTTLGSSEAGVSNSLIDANFIRQNSEGIYSTTIINSLFYPFLNLYHRQIQLNFNWPFKSIFQQWYMFILPLNLFFIVTIFLAGVIGKRSSPQYKSYLISSLCFILALYFFTVNIGEFTFGNVGINSFIFMINNVPGFIIFRNMYDKFGHAMSFVFSLMLAISMFILLDNSYSGKIKRVILVFYGVIVFLNAYPFLTNKFNKAPIWTTSNTFQGIREFNQDYVNLVTYVSSQEYKGRYAILPLSGGNVIAIRDKYLPNNFYIGVSPLLILSGKNDYSGYLSFGIYQTEVEDAIRNKDYERLGRIFQKMNISYIIVNRDVPDELRNSYIYPANLYFLQDENFLQQILGQKIIDFGNKYSLYEINNTYANQKIYVTESVYTIPQDFSSVTYIKKTSYDFEVNIKNLNKASYLVFLEEAKRGWNLQLANGERFPTERVPSSYFFQNVWKVDPDQIKKSMSPDSYTTNPDGSLNITFHIYFSPIRYYYPSLLISVVSFTGISMYVLYSFLKDKKFVQKLRKYFI